MNKLRITLFAMVGMVVLTAFNSCNRGSNLVQGGTSETENTISGTVQLEGSPSPQTKVQLYSKNYNPLGDSSESFTQKTITSDSGSYSFSNVPLGEYVLIAELDNENQMALLNVVITKNGITEVEDMELENSGTIVMSLAEFPAIQEEGYIYIPGTDISVQITEEDINKKVIFIQDVPTESFNDIIYVNLRDSSAQDLIKDSVVVEEKDSLTLLYSNWPHRKKLSLDLGGAGVKLSEKLLSFPMLIRLDEKNFNFSNSASMGKDIRFTNPQLEGLPFQIERWDSLGQFAEIWVSWDTIHPGFNDQYIIMYSGYGDTVTAINQENVFDSTLGYFGVYHMNQETNGNKENGLMDYSDFEYHGSPKGYSVPSKTKGMVGEALTFDGMDDEIQLPNHPIGETFSISAWVQGDWPNINYRHVVSRHPGWLISGEGTEKTIRFAVNASTDSLPNWSWSTFDSTRVMQIDTWYHLVGVYDGLSLKSYFNGVLVDSLTANLPGEVNLDGHTRIGNYWLEGQFNYHWPGAIDEVRLSNKVVTSDWIRLSFENQKKGSTVIDMTSFP